MAERTWDGRTWEALMDRYNIPPDLWESLYQSTLSLAYSTGCSLEEAIHMVALTLDAPPIRQFGVLVPRRWWQRPYWLWRKSIQRRAWRAIQEEEDT